MLKIFFFFGVGLYAEWGLHGHYFRSRRPTYDIILVY